MVEISSKALTLEEFLKVPETKPACEYINGSVIQKPMPKTRHSRLQGKLTRIIRGKSSQDTFCRHVKLERLAMKELQK